MKFERLFLILFYLNQVRAESKLAQRSYVGSIINRVSGFFSYFISEDSISDSVSEAFMNITQLVKLHGYHLEEYIVETEDEYILKVYRLLDKNKCNNGPVVFLMHGIVDSSDSWILQGPEKAFGYLLADQGYDVWMGNARGNKYGLQHKNLTTIDEKFWDFTWEEIGIYDLPAMIDFVLKETNKSDLYYVGHSQGTTTFYVMGSMLNYNDKIKMMFSLAPVAWIGNAKSPILKIFSPANELIAYFLTKFNRHSPTTEIFNKISWVFCYLFSSCNNIMELFIGHNNKFMNDTFIPTVMGHIPCGSSIMQFVHYGQLYNSGRFCRFDFGEIVNMDMYGQRLPPDYDLNQITTPIVLYYSDNDWLSDSKDVENLRKHLPNVKKQYDFVDFNHIDFMYASVAKDLIYTNIIDQIKENELS